MVLSVNKFIFNIISTYFCGGFKSVRKKSMYVLIVCLHKGLELTLGQSLVMRMLIVFALPWTTLQICALKIPRNCCIFEIP